MQQYQKQNLDSYMCCMLNGAQTELNRYGLYDLPQVRRCTCMDDNGDHTRLYQEVYSSLSEGGRKYFDDYIRKQIYRTKTDVIISMLESENIPLVVLFKVFHKTVTYEVDEEEMYQDFLLNYIIMKHGPRE